MGKYLHDYCMLCDSAPCQCGKPKRVTTRSIKKAASATVATPPKKSLTTSAPRREVAPPPKPKLTVELREDDVLLNAAIRTLADAGLLGAEALIEYSTVLQTTPSPQERLAVWKARRRYDA